MSTLQQASGWFVLLALITVSYFLIRRFFSRKGEGRQGGKEATTPDGEHISSPKVEKVTRVVHREVHEKHGDAGRQVYWAVVFIIIGIMLALWVPASFSKKPSPHFREPVTFVSVPATPERTVCPELHDGESQSCTSTTGFDIRMATTDGVHVCWGGDFDILAAKGKVQYFYKEDGITRGPVIRTGSDIDLGRVKTHYLIDGTGPITYDAC
jgi:hypothetical protein